MRRAAIDVSIVAANIDWIEVDVQDAAYAGNNSVRQMRLHCVKMSVPASLRGRVVFCYVFAVHEGSPFEGA